MPIDSFEAGLDWATPGYVPSSFEPVGGNMFISLGGSLRITSDFIGSSASIWLRGLSLSRSLVTNENGQQEEMWGIGASASDWGTGGYFELIDPVVGLAENGWITLEADYKLGSYSNLVGLLGLTGDATTTVLGHISINPSAVPVPAAGWLMGSALLGLVGLRRRKNIG
ncbi:MAG: VPLPA-CTERM sorting domain-containing protein [Methylococcaceae bacterium]|nr:VPLPA-CTERM sorting domain-containing protein [Methylococcaceae bacterium]